MRTRRVNVQVDEYGHETVMDEYRYEYSDGRLVRMYFGGKWMVFTYGADGRPLGVNYDGSQYYYDLNLQGDVIGIRDNTGTKVASYTYDAWGRTLSMTHNTLAHYNPLRYRGYVYDRETGLYYLQSRYYDPVVGRFINADNLAYLGVDDVPLGYNLFAYCQNDPVMGVDYSGNWSWGWEDEFELGFTALIVGIAIIAAAPTGGTSLALGAVMLSSSALITTGVVVSLVGTVMMGDALLSAEVTYAKESKKSKKERSTDRPSWVSQSDIDLGKSAQQNATELLDEKFGKGNWTKGPTSDYNRIVKWINRSLKILFFLCWKRWWRNKDDSV